ncbi:MAG: TetR family transcriptional regulator C-terminal domain-containing protein [Microlunatus sp.]
MDRLAERRATIMAATEQLLAVHGFDAMRLRDVAQQAGVSIGLIQHYFGTRDDLLFETMRTAGRRRAEQWVGLATSATSAGDKLAALLDGAISDPHRCVIWLETCAASSRHPELRRDVQLTQDTWRETIGAIVDEGLAAGEFVPVVPVEDLVVLLVSLIDGLMLATVTQSADEGGQTERTRLLRQTAGRLLGLSAEREWL